MYPFPNFEVYFKNKDTKSIVAIPIGLTIVVCLFFAIALIVS